MATNAEDGTKDVPTAVYLLRTCRIIIPVIHMAAMWTKHVAVERGRRAVISDHPTHSDHLFATICCIEVQENPLAESRKTFRTLETPKEPVQIQTDGRLDLPG